MKYYIVRLGNEEREYLRGLVKKGHTAAYKIRHAHILLAVDADGPNWTDVRAAEAYGCYHTTVAEIRRRFVEQGLEAALNRKKQDEPSRKPILDGEKEAILIAQACSKPPEGRSRWTLKLLADRLIEMEVVESISPQVVMNALKKTNTNLI